jgi:hypothetical protein
MAPLGKIYSGARPTYPSLTPTYGLGSYGRTGTALLVSSPRNKIGSQGRIYGYYASRGQGTQYINFLKQAIGPTPNYNPRNNFTLIGF